MECLRSLNRGTLGISEFLQNAVQTVIAILHSLISGRNPYFSHLECPCEPTYKDYGQKLNCTNCNYPLNSILAKIQTYRKISRYIKDIPCLIKFPNFAQEQDLGEMTVTFNFDD